MATVKSKSAKGSNKKTSMPKGGLSGKQLEAVVGGVLSVQPPKDDQCKETGDSGTMGCGG